MVKDKSTGELQIGVTVFDETTRKVPITNEYVFLAL